MTRTLIIASILILAVSPVSLAGLIANGGFEAADSGSPPDPSSWVEYGPDLTGEISPAYRRSGAYSAKRWTGGDSQEYGYYQNFAVSPGEEYEARGFLFSPAADALSGSSYASLKLEFYSAAWQRLSQSESARLIRAIPDFTPYSVAAVAPPGAVHGRVLFAVGAGSAPHGGAAYCDDLSVDAVPVAAMDDEEFLNLLQRRIFDFFWMESSPLGLIKDRANNFRSDSYSVSSIASVGFGLSAICIAESRGWVSAAEAHARILTTLETFRDRLVTTDGFFYHFVDMNTGQAAPGSEVSTIDTALFVYGALLAGEYFEARHGDASLKQIAEAIYRRVDWPAAHAGGGTYSEYMMMDLLATASPTHPIAASRWAAINRNFQDAIATRTWDHSYPRFFYSSLFVHQYPQCYLDFRFRRDAFNGLITYFDSSRNMTRSNRQYCLDHSVAQGIAVPKFQTFQEHCWGLTAADGPDGYFAYGEAEPNLLEPQGSWRLDGTVMPHGPGGSVMFAPDICIPALRFIRETYGGRVWGRYGFIDSFNIDRDWWDPDVIGIDLGAMMMSIENYRTGLPWRYLMLNPWIRAALNLTGFQDDRQPSFDDFDDGAPDAWGGSCDAEFGGGSSGYVQVEPYNGWVEGSARRFESSLPDGGGLICLNGYNACYDDAVTFWLHLESGGANLLVGLADTAGRTFWTPLAEHIPLARMAAGWQWVRIPLDAFAGVHLPSLASLSFRFPSGGAVLVDHLAFTGAHPDSSAILAGTLADAARLPEGTRVAVNGLVVTENFGGFFYAEQADRASGIRVLFTGAYIPGDVVSVDGVVGLQDGERVVEPRAVARNGRQVPLTPLVVRPCALRSQGVRTQGLYVKTWGRAGAPSGDGFTVMDDCGGAVRVVASGLSRPPEGAMVLLNGVVGAAADGEDTVPVVRVRGQGGITVVQ